MSNFLPNDQTEPDESDDSTSLTAADTPFTGVPYVTTTATGPKSLERALSLHEELEARGEGYDEEFEEFVEPFRWDYSDNTLSGPIVYWKYVAPTLATSPHVEWVGHHGYDESEGFPSFPQLWDIAKRELPDNADETDSKIAARIVDKIGYRHKQENGRRVSPWEVSRKTSDASRWKRVYSRYVPLMPQIRPANGRNDPDWRWIGD